MKISTICFPIQDGKIFLSNKKCGFGVGYLNGYGGKKEETDLTIEDAAIRELKEESGVTVMVDGLEKVAEIDFFEEDNQIFECHIYFCHEWEGDFIETEEMAKPELYELDNLPYDNMWHSDKTWLPLVCSGQRIKAKSFYDRGMKYQVKFEHKKL